MCRQALSFKIGEPSRGIERRYDDFGNKKAKGKKRSSTT